MVTCTQALLMLYVTEAAQFSNDYTLVQRQAAVVYVRQSDDYQTFSCSEGAR